METVIYATAFVLFIIVIFAKYLFKAFLWIFIPETIKGKAKLIAYKKIDSEFSPEMFCVYPSSFDNPQPLDAISSAHLSKFLYPNLKLDRKEDDSGTTLNISDYFIRILHSGKKYTLEVSADVYAKILAQKKDGVDEISIVLKKFAWKYQYISLAK